MNFLYKESKSKIKKTFFFFFLGGGAGGGARVSDFFLQRILRGDYSK